MSTPRYDVAVIGGGPAGATAAHELAARGYRVLLLDKAGRIKPCGGAIPPRLLHDFDIPRSILDTEVHAARMISPSARHVDMPIDSGFVGMVDRAHFDEWLRQRSAAAGAERVAGRFERLGGTVDDDIELTYRRKPQVSPTPALDTQRSPCANNAQVDSNEAIDEDLRRVRVRYLIGADGARSEVARQALPCANRRQAVFAYHQILPMPDGETAPRADSPGFRLNRDRCDVVYDGRLSPDFYSWVFPHGDTVSIGTGTAVQGHSLRQAVTQLKHRVGMEAVPPLRSEGAPIPLKPLRRWDDGRHVLVCGDAAGVVAPASGEGIYYAMLSGRLAADAVAQAIELGRPACLRQARRRFLRQHGLVFLILRIMQRFWYHTDQRRERFVTLCRDKDVQRLTWESYLDKRLSYRSPLSHVRIFFKDLSHLLGLRSETQ